jgi:hypothetical protein
LYQIFFVMAIADLSQAYSQLPGVATVFAQSETDALLLAAGPASLAMLQ